MNWDDPETRFHVVINGEGQYSIWPDHKPVPLGWLAVGVSGTRDHCLAHIESVWTDMRPLSLRRALGDAA